MSRATRATLAALTALTLASCVVEQDPSPSECACEPSPAVPCAGEATLEARALHGDTVKATLSFEHATVEEDGAVNNDWDLLYGNDLEPGLDLFTVNTGTDDRSWIVDLGPLPSLADVPAEVDPARFGAGRWGEHDDVPVVLGHVYLVRTVDENSRLFAAFRVTAHDVDRSVTLRWFRSADPERFALPGR
jgi:hypothetical protein